MTSDNEQAPPSEPTSPTEKELIRSLTVEILTLQEVFFRFSDEVTAAQRIMLTAVLNTTLTPEQRAPVMALADRLADAFVQPGAAPDVQDRLRQLVLYNVAGYSRAKPSH